jgi:hypothetical protein
MAPAPSFDELETDPSVECGHDDQDLATGFILQTNGCPSSLPTAPTLWQYIYRPASGTGPRNVYATYAIYYHISGDIEAERLTLSDVYAATIPPPQQAVTSGRFTLPYPDVVTVLKFRSFATQILCSQTTPEGCWAEAEPLGTAGYHDEVRFCIFRTPELNFSSFCRNDNIDGYAPEIAIGKWHTPIRFAIEVASSTSGPVYVSLNDAEGQVGWVRAFWGGVTGERIYLKERCEIADCGLPPVVCGASIPMIRDLAGPQNRSVAFVWDGKKSVFEFGCEGRQPASTSGSYVAKFCYSTQAQVEGSGDPYVGVPGQLLNPTCVTRTFGRSDNEVVLML